MLFSQALDIPDSLKTSTLSLLLQPERLRYNVRIKPSDLAAVKKTSGLKFPSKIWSSHFSAAMSILCLGPDEWLVIADPKEQMKLSRAFAKIEAGFTISIADVSHRNIGFDVAGTDATRLLNAGCPLDLSLDAFPIGKTTRTVFESASIILTRRGETDFQIECWRSFAPYLRDFFERIVETHA